jgi:hypothetical protein
MTEDGENIIQGTGTKRKRDEGVSSVWFIFFFLNLLRFIYKV